MKKTFDTKVSFAFYAGDKLHRCPGNAHGNIEVAVVAKIRSLITDINRDWRGTPCNESRRRRDSKHESRSQERSVSSFLIGLNRKS